MIKTIVKTMIENRLNSLFLELEQLANEVAEIEVQKQSTTSIQKIIKKSISEDNNKKIMSLTMQFHFLSNIGV